MTKISHRSYSQSSSSTEYSPAIYTGTATASSLTFGNNPADAMAVANIEAWESVINYKLIDWGMNAERGLNPDEFLSPTKASVEAAIQIVEQQRNFRVADRVMPNGDGGISFEWEEGDWLIKFEVLYDGRVQRTAYEGPNLRWHNGF